jgi:hypothetical protein
MNRSGIGMSCERIGFERKHCNDIAALNQASDAELSAVVGKSRADDR